MSTCTKSAICASVFYITLACYSLPANAEWLSLCQQAQSAVKGDGYLAHIITPQENAKILHLTKERNVDATCLSHEVPIAIENVSWSGFSPGLSDQAEKISLLGALRENTFRVSEIIIDTQENTPVKATVKAPPITQFKKRSTTRSAWFWLPRAWLASPERIFDKQKMFKLDRIYITVPTQDNTIAHIDELKIFIKNAHKKKLQVWAVAGDPQAILDSARGNYLSMAAAYGQYNDDAMQTERLDGLQLDIEPYLIPGYQYAKPEMMEKYAEVVNMTHQAAPTLALDIVLPFWFNVDDSVMANALDDISESISSLTIMDYRTDVEQIKRFANKFLAWGERHQKSVHIALESLALKNGEIRHYQRADSGELVGINLGEMRVLLLLKEPLSKQNEVLVYQYSHTQLVEGSNTSFYGEQNKLMQLLPQLENEFERTPSFSGMSLHGLD